MVSLWRRWIGYPVAWLVIIAATIAALAIFGSFAGAADGPPMTSFAATYRAVPSDDGVRLEVTESITDVLDLTREGITRRLITSYGDESVEIHSIEAASPDGEPMDFRQREEDNGDISLLVDRHEPVSRAEWEEEVTFVISYVIDRPVVQSGHGQQLYFNVNGTEWSNGFDDVTMELIVDDALAANLTGEAACYQGRAGSEDQCTIRRDGTRARASASASAARRASGSPSTGTTPTTRSIRSRTRCVGSPRSPSAPTRGTTRWAPRGGPPT